MNIKKTENLLKQYLESIVGKNVYDSYFSNITLSLDQNSVIKVHCANNFLKHYIQSKFSQLILDYINSNDTTSYTLEFVTKPYNKDNDFSVESVRQSNLNSIGSSPLEHLKNFANNHISFKKQLFDFSTTLNPTYTFENFVPGSNNLLAHAASKAVSESPGSVYNPLFIYGDVGLGKTHLMHSIGNELKVKNSNFKILYCTTEQFLNDMVQSIKSQKTLDFRSKYRSIDLLLLDDIQFISNKVALQEEFFNTFNSLYQSGKQIVIASDRPPSAIQHLEDRIRSRFEGGLVADVQKPDYETRIAIIEKKLQQRGEFLSKEVIYRLAEILNTNIREIEGAVLKLSILSRSKNSMVSVTDLSKIFDYKIRHSVTKKISYTQIIKDVSETMQVSIREIKSSKRTNEITLARHVCMFLIKDILNMKLQRIAKILGRKDHTTVIHGIKRIKLILETNPSNEVSRMIVNFQEKYSPSHNS